MRFPSLRLPALPLAMGVFALACHADLTVTSTTPDAEAPPDASARDDAPSPAACPPPLALLPMGSGGGRYFALRGHAIVDAVTQSLVLDLGPSVAADAGENVGIDKLLVDDRVAVFTVFRGYVPSGSTSLFTQPLAGGPPTLLAKADDGLLLAPLAIHGRKIYWTLQSSSSTPASTIYASDEDGGQAAVAVGSVPTVPGAMVFHGDTAFFASASPDPDGGAGHGEIDTFGVAPASSIQTWQPADGLRGLAIQGDALLYFTSTTGSYPVQDVQSSIFTRALSAGTPTALVSTVTPAIGAFATTARYAYWVGYGIQYPETPNDEWYLDRAPLAGGAVETLASHPSTYDANGDYPSIFAGDGWLAWQNRAGLHVVCD